MKNNFLPLVLILAIFNFTGCKAQEHFGENYLQVGKIISLPNVKGRIDHLDVNVKEQIVYIAALGNNSVEIVDLKNGRVIHSITGLNEPQGVGYIPDKHEIFVANGGNGDCYFFNASTFEKTASIHLSSDADDVRYDSISAKIYVGYGQGGIAVIDANTHTQVADVSLPAHPEGFQLDKPAKRILVNIPDKNMIGVIDLVQLKLINKWSRSSPTANFPMATDDRYHYAFIGYRHPAKLVILDAKTGKEISTYNMVSDIDDLYFDNEKKRIYISGGGGFINIFQQDNSLFFKQVANIPTRSGARTSLFIPELKIFAVAEPAESNKCAQLLVYNVSR
jgi:DNA-binding beta-propeller fold protein YncE